MVAESSSSLKLIMQKGPRAGETLEFPSTRSLVIKIGRLVRGNTIAIKDPAISTKHLSIQFDSAAVNWTLLDLDSSNGTILNSVNLVPLQPTVIKDGDTIKIGECTSILVGIDIVESRFTRRNPKRGRKGGELDDMVAAGVGDCGQLGLGPGVAEVAPVKRNLRGRPPIGGDSKYEVRMCTRRMHSSKKEEDNVRFHLTTLGEIPECLSVDGSTCKQLDSLVRKGRRGSKTSSRNLRNNSLEKVKSLGGEGGCGESEKFVAVDEGTPNGPLEARGVDVREETRVTDELDSLKAFSGVNEREDKRVENDVNSGGHGSDWLRKDGVLEEPDLAKMTLGEWFDYVEVYLPKVIHDETETMISSMKEQAAKFHEFRLQQEMLKDK